jgi:hypothetical protein
MHKPLMRKMSCREAPDGGALARRSGTGVLSVLAAMVLVACGGGGSSPTPPPPTNAAPTIAGTPATSVDEDVAYSFTPTASDADGDALTFSVTNAPAWIVFDPVTGVLEGTPGDADVGIVIGIVISVSDGEATASLAAFDLEVRGVNDAPTISGTPPTTVNEDVPYAFTPTAFDVEGGPLTFLVQNAPPWSAFDAATGTLSGTPREGDAGAYSDIVISVSDGEFEAALETFAITVLAVNDAPQITGTAPAAVNEGEVYTFTPTALDPDGDVLTFTIENAPPWASFDTTTGTLSGTPGEADDGAYGGIVIAVTDGTLSATLAAFGIEVLEVNDAPHIGGTPATAVDEGDLYSFTPAASDSDPQDTLSFAIENKPSWADFDQQTGELSGSPADGDAGVYGNIVISVSDALTSSSLPAFDIRVVEVTTLQLTGKVTDAPVANATLTLTAGRAVITSVADADGDYSVALRLRDGDFDPDSLVSLRALGVDAQAQVELTSVLGDIGQLLAAAGGGETLDAIIFPRLNVTHLSTARRLLAEDLNGGADPADALALLRAETAIPTDALLDLAALIKLIVDEDLLAVPEGESTFSLLRSDSPGVSNRSTIDQLLIDEQLVDAATGVPTDGFAMALAAARSDTLGDPDVVAAPVAAQLIGTTVWTPEAPPDVLPREFTGKSVAEFAEDGTGVLYQSYFLPAGLVGTRLAVSPFAFDWALGGNLLSLDFSPVNETIPREEEIDAPFTALVEVYGFDQEVADFLVAAGNDGAEIPPQLPLGERLVRRTATTATGVGGSFQALVEDTVEYDLDPLLDELGWIGPLPRGRAARSSSSVISQPDPAGRPFTADLSSRQVWSLPTFYSVSGAEATVGLAQDLFLLQEDGFTTAGLLSGQVFAWSFLDGALVLSSNEERYTYRRLRNVAPVEFLLVTHEVGGVVEARFTDWAARQLQSATAFFDALPAQSLPDYWLDLAESGADRSDAYLADGRLDVRKLTGWLFDGDFTATRFLASGGSCLNDDSTGCFETEGGAGAWSWVIGGSNGTRNSLARTLNANTVREREWEVLRFDEASGQAVVLELEFLRLLDPGGRDLRVPPRLNRIDLRDLSTYPEEFQDAIDAGFPAN